MPRLLLFDVDGTLLLRASAEHRDAVHEAIREVWPTADPDAVHVEAAGRTDLDIARDLLLLAGIDARRIDDGLQDFRDAAIESYARRCPPDLRHKVAPGVPAVLEALRDRGDLSRW